MCAATAVEKDGAVHVPLDIAPGIDLYIMTTNGTGASGRGAGGTEVEVVTSG